MPRRSSPGQIFHSADDVAELEIADLVPDVDGRSEIRGGLTGELACPCLDDVDEGVHDSCTTSALISRSEKWSPQ